MFDFDFSYKEKSVISAKAVTKAVYYTFGGEVVVAGEEILSHPFSVSHELHLYGDGRNYTISQEGLISINVTRSEG